MRKLLLAALLPLLMLAGCENGVSPLEGKWIWEATVTGGSTDTEYRDTITPESTGVRISLQFTGENWELSENGTTANGTYELKEEEGMMYISFSEEWDGDKKQFIELEDNMMVFRECPDCTGGKREYWTKN